MIGHSDHLRHNYFLCPLHRVQVRKRANTHHAEIKKLGSFPREILQNSHSVTSHAQPGVSLSAARSMRDYAAQLGAGLPKYLLAQEVIALLSCFEDLSQRMFFDTLWNTGARLNEALALRPVDLQLDTTTFCPQPVAVIRTLKQRDHEASRSRGRPTLKSAPVHPDPRYRKPPEPGTRLVPLLDATYAQRMREYLATWKKRVKHQPIWNITSRQTPVNWLAGALARAECDGVTFSIPVSPHTFRHSFAMHLAMNGCPEPVLQSLLGHRYARSTAVYTKVFSLDVLTGKGLSFSGDPLIARAMLANIPS